MFFMYLCLFMLLTVQQIIIQEYIKMSESEMFKKSADTHVGTMSWKTIRVNPRILFTKIYILRILT